MSTNLSKSSRGSKKSESIHLAFVDTPAAPPPTNVEFAAALIRVNAECFRFVSQRLMAQVERLNRLAQCKDVDAMIVEETSFIKDAAEDYAQEAEMIAAAARNALPDQAKSLGAKKQ